MNLDVMEDHINEDGNKLQEPLNIQQESEQYRAAVFARVSLTFHRLHAASAEFWIRMKMRRKKGGEPRSGEYLHFMLARLELGRQIHLLTSAWTLN